MTRRPLGPRLASRRPPSIDRALQQVLRDHHDSDFTYRPVGITRSGGCPDGFDPLRVHAVVGHGRPAFVALAQEIRGWAVHRGAGLEVASSGPATSGVDVALAKALGPVAIVFGCRVVWVLDEPDRAGFGYGTLPGHPESGEESFVAELTPDGDVHFTVAGFSRPGTLLTALSAPLGGLLQRASLSAYVGAARLLAAA